MYTVHTCIYITVPFTCTCTCIINMYIVGCTCTLYIRPKVLCHTCACVYMYMYVYVQCTCKSHEIKTYCMNICCQTVSKCTHIYIHAHVCIIHCTSMHRIYELYTLYMYNIHVHVCTCWVCKFLFGSGAASSVQSEVEPPALLSSVAINPHINANV